jgi:hypothetical protein
MSARSASGAVVALAMAAEASGGEIRLDYVLLTLFQNFESVNTHVAPSFVHTWSPAVMRLLIYNGLPSSRELFRWSQTLLIPSETYQTWVRTMR